MSRKEEIELAWFRKAVQSNHRYDEKTFKEAVEWADETIVDKACKVLKSIIDEDVFVKCGNVIKIVNADEFTEYFRKAMEE